MACFLLSFVTALSRPGLGRRLVRTTNLSILFFNDNPIKRRIRVYSQGRKSSAILNVNWPGYQGFENIGGKNSRTQGFGKAPD